MSLTLHGVRGSIPTTNFNVAKYGGNTSCFEIQTEHSQLFVDAGTGFSSVNFDNNGKKVYLFFSHLHHDHVQGLVFNPQLFGRKEEIILSSGLMSGLQLKEYLTNYFSPPFFPPNVFSQLTCFKFMDWESVRELAKPDVLLDSIHLKHPGGAVGYSFAISERKIVIALDNEFDLEQERDLIHFCEDTDILIWDGMFTETELETKKGWGHSTVEQAEYFFSKSKVKKIIICHHSPTRKDADLDIMRTNLSLPNIEFGIEKAFFNL